MASANNDVEVRKNTASSKLPITLLSKTVAAIRRGFSSRMHSEPRMELIETLQLGSRRQLMLVLCDGERYLIGAGNDSVQSIAAASGNAIPKALPPVVVGNPNVELSH